MESAVKGVQKSFQLSSLTLLFLYNKLFKEKKTLTTFSTPFTCTEIIAHVKTLKYFALASKISVGAEDKSQNLLILWVDLWTQTDLIASFLVSTAARNTVFIFVCLFYLCLPCIWEKSFNLIILMLPPNYVLLFRFFFSSAIASGFITEFQPQQILRKGIYLLVKLLPWHLTDTAINVTKTKHLDGSR